jgi:hypothetical protein
MKKAIIFGTAMICLIFFIQTAYADVCQVRGSIYYSDNEPLSPGEDILFLYPYYNKTMEAKTGIGLHKENYYMISFFCKQEDGYVLMETLGERHNVSLESGLSEYDMYLSFPKPEEPPEEPPDDPVDDDDDDDRGDSKGSGGSSSGSGPAPIGVSFERKNVSFGSELILLYDEEWLDLTRYVIKVLKDTNSTAKFFISPGDIQFILGTGQKRDVDLNSDGSFDIELRLDEISGNIAYVSMKKIYRLPNGTIYDQYTNKSREDRDVEAQSPDDLYFLFREKKIDRTNMTAYEIINLLLIIIIAALVIALVLGHKKRRRKKARK